MKWLKELLGDAYTDAIATAVKNEIKTAEDNTAKAVKARLEKTMVSKDELRAVQEQLGTYQEKDFENNLKTKLKELGAKDDAIDILVKYSSLKPGATDEDINNGLETLKTDFADRFTPVNSGGPIPPSPNDPPKTNPFIKPARAEAMAKIK